MSRGGAEGRAGRTRGWAAAGVRLGAAPAGEVAGLAACRRAAPHLGAVGGPGAERSRSGWQRGLACSIALHERRTLRSLAALLQEPPYRRAGAALEGRETHLLCLCPFFPSLLLPPPPRPFLSLPLSLFSSFPSSPGSPRALSLFLVPLMYFCFFLLLSLFYSFPFSLSSLAFPPPHPLFSLFCFPLFCLSVFPPSAGLFPWQCMQGARAGLFPSAGCRLGVKPGWH